MIGADNVAKSAPDGYTIMVHSVSHLTNSFSYNKLPYDTLKDFEPVALLANQPYVLVVHPALPVKSVKDFIALAKAKPQCADLCVERRRRRPARTDVALRIDGEHPDGASCLTKGGGPMAASLIVRRNPVFDGDGWIDASRSAG